MITRIHHITLITPKTLITDACIDIKDGKILAAGKDAPCWGEDIHLIDGGGCYAAPGFVDIHVHGGGGFDFMKASPEQIRQGCIAHARRGTTTILPTTVTASVADTAAMIENVRKAQALTEECTIAGVHLEGPFLSPAQAGAQDPENLICPNIKILETLEAVWPGGIRIMGAAPELPGGVEFGAELKSRGILATIAHSDADYRVCAQALASGYSDITHIYSGCSIVHRTNGYRAGGVVEAGLLEDGFTVQVIADGKHLPGELLRLIFKCKGPERISLITDALFPAAGGFPEGAVLQQTDGRPIILEDGVLKLEDRQAFAGSVATMDRLVRNMVELAGVSLSDAITMATATPARVAGLSSRKGSIAPGMDADIVLLDEALQVKSVVAMGKLTACG